MGKQIRHLGSEVVRYYEVNDWKEAKFPESQRTLQDWKDLVSEEGKEKIEKLIKEEILKKLGS